MEISGFYYHDYINVCQSEYITFVRKNDLIRIEMQTPIESAIVTINIDDFQDGKLYAYYKLSLAMTSDVSKISFSETGSDCDYFPDRQWVIETVTSDRWNSYDMKKSCSFETDPRNWTLHLSSEEEIDDFYRCWFIDGIYEMCPYSIMDSFIQSFAGEIERELEMDEKIIENVDYEIKASAILMSKLNLDIIQMIMN